MDKEEAKKKLVEKIVIINLITLAVVILISYISNIIYALLIAPIMLIGLTIYIALEEDI